MESLLFLSQRIPFPPNKGDKIRSYNILRHLAKTYRIQLATFVDDPDDWRHTGVLEDICEHTCFIPLHRRTATARSAMGFFSGEALSLPFYRDRRFAAWVADETRREPADVVFCYSSAVGQYLDHVANQPRRTIVDFVDVDSDKWRQYAKNKRWPVNWVYAREADRLLAFDRMLAGRADANIVVSDDEAALFRQLAPEIGDKVFGIGNGIDADYFSPEHDFPSVLPVDRPSIVFTGAMDYWPNVDAVQWFATDILPRIREQAGTVAFFIVGSNPTSDVLALGRLDDVHVTGRVEDVRPYIAGAAVSVAPMRIARGIQNKVLEAMAMAKPTVTTPEGIEGIEATAGQHVLVASGGIEFADTVVQAIRNDKSKSIGMSARAHVIERYSWPARLASIDRLIAG